MTKEIYTTYSEDVGITVILEDTKNDNGDTVSTEIKGFYHGQPNEHDTKEYYGKLKAEY